MSKAFFRGYEVWKWQFYGRLCLNLICHHILIKSAETENIIYFY